MTSRPMNLGKFFYIHVPLAMVGGLMICVLGPLSIIPPLGRIFAGWVDRYVDWTLSLD